MSTRLQPIFKKFPHLIHGGDYNPEQWMDTPEVWQEDMRLMKLAGVNSASIGIFSWAKLEPAEGQYDLGWIDRVMDMLAENEIQVVLATPTGARPAWMAQKYPEVLRVDGQRRRHHWGGRHNHCFTSPVYREKSRGIATKLAERYKDHPTLAMWHVNNEYSGACHCDLCQNAFRDYLKKKYDNDLDALNKAYWSVFWSHTYTDWTHIEAPSSIGEDQVHALNLDWKRFTTAQTIDFFKAESEPLRRITPNLPVTTNFMGIFSGLDYYDFAKQLDVISWDSYPSYHDRPENWLDAVVVSFIHSQRRAMLQKPFMMMECSPGVQNYKPVCKLKRPGLHITEALQAIAHGSDSVQYFQWRKSRGSFEKFHGAVVDHYAVEDTRVFKEVAELGSIMGKLDAVVGTMNKAEVALIYDYENKWALDDTAGPRNLKKDYPEVCHLNYRAFWMNGVDVDIIGDLQDFSGYKLLIAPMLYMIKPGVAERIAEFVRNGGTFVTTYWSGIVNETDLCFLNGFPGPLREICGVWAEEIDALYDDESVPVVPVAGNKLGLKRKYNGGIMVDLLHAEGAKVLATFGSEFYKGSPALTVNGFGNGKAYYVASKNDQNFQLDFYGALIDELDIPRAIGKKALPEGVTAAVRSDGEQDYVFVMNFSRKDAKIDLGKAKFTSVLTGEKTTGPAKLGSYETLVLNRPTVAPGSVRAVVSGAKSAAKKSGQRKPNSAVKVR